MYDILVSTSQNENKNIRISSIITLGYLGQELTTNEINDEQVSKIISAICLILNDDTDEDILIEAIQTMLLFLPFAKKNFSNNVKIIFFSEYLL